MATTTNYGWTTPDDTSLVKDGAAAIRTLGSSIDTSLNTALGTKKAGLVLLNTTSFSAVTAVSLPTSTFNSTYDHYRLVFNITAISGGLSTSLRMRTSGTDNSSASYYATTSGGASWTNGTYTYYGSTTDTSHQYMITPTVGVPMGFLSLDIFNPFATQRTGWVGLSSSGNEARTIQGGFNATTSFDSLSIIASANNMTGSYSIYGYNK